MANPDVATAIPPVLAAQPGHRWEGVPVHPYKETGDHFRSIARQTLFPGAHDLGVELRYFEIQPGGHSTLERHQHAHLVVVIRGVGRVLVGDRVRPIGLHDIVHVEPWTWHQFQPAGDEPLGFLCLVNPERDRPVRPDATDLAALRRTPEVAEFIRV